MRQDVICQRAPVSSTSARSARRTSARSARRTSADRDFRTKSTRSASPPRATGLDFTYSRCSDYDSITSRRPGSLDVPDSNIWCNQGCNRKCDVFVTQRDDYVYDDRAPVVKHRCCRSGCQSLGCVSQELTGATDRSDAQGKTVVSLAVPRSTSFANRIRPCSLGYNRSNAVAGIHEMPSWMSFCWRTMCLYQQRSRPIGSCSFADTAKSPNLETLPECAEDSDHASD